MIKAVCFDMDGVLVDSERLGAMILNEAAALQNIRLEQEQKTSLLGCNMETTHILLTSWFPDIDVYRFTDDWCRLMLEHVNREGLPLMPDAREVLKELRDRGILLALCTSNATDVVENYLKLAEWEHGVFDRIITGDMIQHGKPAPDIYLEGADRLGVRPSECIGVEDSYNGVRSVRAAGMRSVMIPDTMPFTDKFAPYVDDILKDLTGLPGLIGKE